MGEPIVIYSFTEGISNSVADTTFLVADLSPVLVIKLAEFSLHEIDGNFELVVDDRCDLVHSKSVLFGGGCSLLHEPSENFVTFGTICASLFNEFCISFRSVFWVNFTDGYKSSSKVVELLD